MLFARLLVFEWDESAIEMKLLRSVKIIAKFVEKLRNFWINGRKNRLDL